MIKLNKKVALALLSLIACVAMSVLLFQFAAPSSAHAATDTATYSVTDQTGLGLGINVVTAQQANDFTTGHSILSPSKISEMSNGSLHATDYGGGPKCYCYQGDLFGKEQQDILE